MKGWEESGSLTFRGTLHLSFHARAKQYAIEDKDNHTLELSHMLESRNPGVPVPLYDNPAFNMLYLELEGAQELAAQLKAEGGGVSGATDLLHQLQNQVCNYIQEPSLPCTSSCL